MPSRTPFGDESPGPPGVAARTVLAGGASQVRRAGAPEPVRAFYHAASARRKTHSRSLPGSAVRLPPYCREPASGYMFDLANSSLTISQAS